MGKTFLGVLKKKKNPSEEYLFVKKRLQEVSDCLKNKNLYLAKKKYLGIKKRYLCLSLDEKKVIYDDVVVIKNKFLVNEFREKLMGLKKGDKKNVERLDLLFGKLPDFYKKKVYKIYSKIKNEVLLDD